MAVTLSATMSSLLQKHATAKGSVSEAQPKLRAMHHITLQERALMPDQNSLAIRQMKKRGKKRHAQNLHLANPLKSQTCRASCLRKSTSVWKTWTAYLPQILLRFTCGTPACPANLAIFPPWRHFYGCSSTSLLQWRAEGGGEA